VLECIFPGVGAGAEHAADIDAAANAGENAFQHNAVDTLWDLTSLAMSLHELDVAIENGDTLDTLLAGGAVAIDGVAVALPFVPGGAGAVLKATREGGKLVAKVAKGGRNLPFKDGDRLTEINKTLDRIESGGPFPHKKDGTIFRNKEGRLPEGNYREYTVDTPGAPNRGTRRIVQDVDTGRTYYTDDHYQNFIQINPAKR